jgi:S1-C subfamily serine protease
MRRSVASRIAVLVALAAAVVSSIGLAAPVAGGSSTRANAVTDAVVNIYTQLGYQNSAAAGTGIVIGSAGLVLTNNHVIRGATTLRATNVGNGRTYTATVLGYSVSDDVALLQLRNASNLATAKIGGTLRVGAQVTAYGNGHGAGGVPAAEYGTVRAVGRAITASDGQGGSERLTGLIQTDVPLEPGDSGGPLVDANGSVVGMNTAASGGYRFDYRQSSAAFAIPIRKALSIADQIRKGKSTAKIHVGPTAMLGVSVQPSDFGGAGALVAAVVPGSPAERAGIVAGHLITGVGTKTIDSPDDLARELLRLSPKDSVRITWVDELGNRSGATARLATGPPQ